MIYCGHVCEEFVDEIKQVGKVQTKAGTVLLPELVTLTSYKGVASWALIQDSAM